MNLKFSRGVSSKESMIFKPWDFILRQSFRPVPLIVSHRQSITVYDYIANPFFCINCQVKFRNDLYISNFIDILCNSGHLFN